MTTLVELDASRDEATGLLGEVAALEPDERAQKATQLAPLLGRLTGRVEDCWLALRDVLERGMAPESAAKVGRAIVSVSNLILNTMNLLVADKPQLAAFRDELDNRLRPIKARGLTLVRMSALSLPGPDPERLRRSIEQMERGEGVDLEALLAQLRSQAGE